MDNNIVKSYGKAKLIVRDSEIKSVTMGEVAYEDQFTNVSGSHTPEEGFNFSILNKKTRVMTFYKISQNGKFIEDSKENVDTGAQMLLRDDIKDKVFEIVKQNFVDPKFLLQEHYEWVDLSMDSEDISILEMFLIDEFELEGIPFSCRMEWQTLEDVITYIEEALECALHDREDS